MMMRLVRGDTLGLIPVEAFPTPSPVGWEEFSFFISGAAEFDARAEVNHTESFFPTIQLQGTNLLILFCRDERGYGTVQEADGEIKFLLVTGSLTGEAIRRYLKAARDKIIANGALL